MKGQDRIFMLDAQAKSMRNRTAVRIACLRGESSALANGAKTDYAVRGRVIDKMRPNFADIVYGALGLGGVKPPL